MCELIDNVSGQQFRAIQTGEHYLSEIRNIKVTGITWGGNGESAGVVLIAQKELSTKKVLNLITPFTSFESEEYAYTYELRNDIHALVEEIMLYISGKSAMGKQLELTFNEAA